VFGFFSCFYTAVKNLIIICRGNIRRKVEWNRVITTNLNTDSRLVDSWDFIRQCHALWISLTILNIISMQVQQTYPVRPKACARKVSCTITYFTDVVISFVIKTYTMISEATAVQTMFVRLGLTSDVVT
jgi:hypothetical protein